MPAYDELQINKINAILLDALNKVPSLRYQHIIINTWNDQSSTCAAYRFREAVWRERILILGDQFSALAEYYHRLPVPVVHPKLCALISTIDSISDRYLNEQENDALRILKVKKSHVFSLGRDYQLCYIKLALDYHFFVEQRLRWFQHDAQREYNNIRENIYIDEKMYRLKLYELFYTFNKEKTDMQRESQTMLSLCSNATLFSELKNYCFSKRDLEYSIAAFVNDADRISIISWGDSATTGTHLDFRAQVKNHLNFRFQKLCKHYEKLRSGQPNQFSLLVLLNVNANHWIAVRILVTISTRMAQVISANSLPVEENRFYEPFAMGIEDFFKEACKESAAILGAIKFAETEVIKQKDASSCHAWAILNLLRMAQCHHDSDVLSPLGEKFIAMANNIGDYKLKKMIASFSLAAGVFLESLHPQKKLLAYRLFESALVIRWDLYSGKCAVFDRSRLPADVALADANELVNNLSSFYNVKKIPVDVSIAGNTYVNTPPAGIR